MLCMFFFLRFYLFIHERERERGRDTGRGRSRLPAGSLMWDLILGPQDHDLSQRQMLNHGAPQAPHSGLFGKDSSACERVAQQLARFPARSSVPGVCVGGAGVLFQPADPARTVMVPRAGAAEEQREG